MLESLLAMRLLKLRHSTHDTQVTHFIAEGLRFTASLFDGFLHTELCKMLDPSNLHLPSMEPNVYFFLKQS